MSDENQTAEDLNQSAAESTEETEGVETETGEASGDE